MRIHRDERTKPTTYVVGLENEMDVRQTLERLIERLLVEGTIETYMFPFAKHSHRAEDGRTYPF